MEKKNNWTENITKMPGYLPGNQRGIQGTGNEMIAVARALKHGYIVFFKAWPDTNYDLVIDYDSVLFRVEVKGSKGPAINLTRGQRRGRQIDANAPSRERKVGRADCDILIGVDANNGDCYIIPIDYAENCTGKNPTFKSLSYFRERWDFIHGNQFLSAEQCKAGLASADIKILRALDGRLKKKHPDAGASRNELVKHIYENI